MLTYVILFLVGSGLGFLACEFADRWGCSKRYRSPLPKKVFIVCISGIAAAWLFWWEGMLLPPGMQDIHHGFALNRYIIHLTLFVFLLAATLTDFYEMIIPDSITVTGTCVALLAAFMLPLGGLPEAWQFNEDFNSSFATPIHIWSPNLPDFLPSIESVLFTKTLLWWFWCFAMLDRVWYTKLPFRKAAAIFCRYLYRSPRTKYIVAAALTVPFIFVFVSISPVATAPLLSALVGMATGMLLVWGIRLVAQYVLGIEAMGFGDVTLMGMIGAFLGWQAVLLIFFIAPFFGLLYGIVNVALGKGRAVPYGPFLCLATVVVVIAWSPIWAATAEYFAFGIEIIGIALLGLLVLFGGLLHVVHKVMSKR